MFFFHNNSENELYTKSFSDEDINFLVGINGSGKSTYLNDLAEYHIKKGKNVICIANTIYDKFSIRNTKNSYILKNTFGRQIVKKCIYDIIKLLEKDNSKSYYNISLVFEYIKFEPIIEFEIIDLNPNFDKIIRSENFNVLKQDELLFFLNRYSNELSNLNSKKFFLDFNKKPEFSPYGHNIINLFFTLMKYESLLKKFKIFKDIKIYLNKNGRKISVKDASSGELTIIASLLFISNNITKDTVILIDEPENSLHPKWQIEYVKMLTELFYFYQPKIIIATHSPLLINGAELNNKHVNIFKALEFKNFVKEDKDLKNVEEIYEEYFNVVTPQNRFISEHVIEEFNKLINKKINFSDFEIFINDLISNSFDDIQKEALNGILELAKNEI